MSITIEQPIFKRGSVTSANLFEHDYTNSDLMQLCDNYDVKVHKAPVQIGHVDSTSPAFGWIEKLRYDQERGLVMATISYLDEVVDIIRRKLYQFVSATFYPPDVKNHPSSGKGFYLKSLALLGAQPPAVKGLPALDFCDPNDIVCDLIRETLPDELVTLPDELVEVNDEILSLQLKVKQLEIEKEKISLTHYIDKLFQEGNISPSIISPNDLLRMLLYSRGYHEEVQYSENDLFDQITTLLNRLKTVSYSEIPDLKEPLDSTTNPHEKASQLMKQKGIKYRDALKQVLK